MAWFKRKNTAGPAVATPAAEPVAAADPVSAPAPAPVVAPAAPAPVPAPAPSASAAIVTTMMDYPLTLQYAADRAKNYFANREIVTLTADGYDRTSYGQVYDRARQMASALEKLGVKQGDRVATLAWNTSRHFELYLGVPCMGAVLHTLNLRLDRKSTRLNSSHMSIS